MTKPVEFTVRAPEPANHLYAVRARIPDRAGDDHVDLQMPVWSPGSYKVRDYCRHVQEPRAHAPDDSSLPVEKTDKSTWRVACPEHDTVVFEYRVYAHDLNVREKHLDETHGFFQPTALFVYPADELDRPAELTVVAPVDDWSLYCGLERADVADDRGGVTWRAADFDTLFDAPVEMGDHDVLEFEARETDHRMVFWGEGNWDEERLARDLPAIVEANSELFDDLPYDDYLFITLLSGGEYGGLEHRNSTSLLFENDQFGSPDSGDPPLEDDDYLNFLSLVAHEHFHVWNVKRIYPAAIESFDYQAENYVPELWTIEGVTSYYDRLALRRAGLVDAEWLLDAFAGRIRRLEATPGRRLQSIEEAGFDAWIKLYQSDEQTRNATVSYYLKGALVAWLLDIEIRDASDGDRSLDDLVRRIWSEYGPDTERGYPTGTHEAIASDLAGEDLTGFFDAFVRGTEEIEWNERLEPLGLELSREHDEGPNARLGVATTEADGALRVTRTPSDAPAASSGIAPGDELVALDGWRLDDDHSVGDRLDDYNPGDTVDIQLFRRGRLLEREVVLDEARPDDYHLGLRPDADARQERLLEDWLGTSEVPRIDEERA